MNAPTRIRSRLVFAWYDCWIGFYWDKRKRRLYVFPVPMLGVCVQFPILASPPGIPDDSEGE